MKKQPKQLAVWDFPRAGLVQSIMAKLIQAKADVYIPLVNVTKPRYRFLTDLIQERERQKAQVAIHVGLELFSNVPKTARLSRDRKYQIGSHRNLAPIYQKYTYCWDNWLCPSNKQNRDLVLNVTRQLAEFPIEGIHLDFVRFPNSEVMRLYPCMCPACRKARRAYLEMEAVPTSCLFGAANARLLQEKQEARLWDKYKNVKDELLYKEVQYRNQVVRRLVEQLQAVTHRKRLKLSIAARAFYFRDAIFEGQDWAEWSKAGLLDFVCPMSYTAKLNDFRTLVDENLRVLGHSTPCYCGIGRICFKRNGAKRMIEQIQYAWRAGAAGATVFELGRMEEADLNALAALKRTS